MIAPRLSSTHLEELDVVKSRFLKKALRVPMATNNEVVFNLCDTPRFMVDLKEKGYRFNDAVYESYARVLAKKRREEDARSRNQLAFTDPSWKLPLQPRHFQLGYTVHGFHFKICTSPAYHNRAARCICKFCNGSASNVDHLAECPSLTGPLYARYCTVYEPPP